MTWMIIAIVLYVLGIPTLIAMMNDETACPYCYAFQLLIGMCWPLAGLCAMGYGIGLFFIKDPE